MICTELQVLSKTESCLWFHAYKKYKNGNTTRRTASQRHIRPYICYGGSDTFSSGISGKLPKIATSNAILSRTADRIAAKFCMTIYKIKSNDMFQNCVHSCSTLKGTSWGNHSRCAKIGINKCSLLGCNTHFAIHIFAANMNILPLYLRYSNAKWCQRKESYYLVSMRLDF